MIGVFGGSLPQLVSQAEAEAGTVADPRTFTPERVKEAIDALSAIGLVTTKGDILVRNATELIRLAVGVDGQQLEADAATDPGIKWKTPIRFFDFPYRATTNTQTPPPNSGRLIWDDSDQTAATELFLSTTTDAGSTITELLDLVAKSGVQVTIFDRSDLSLRITYIMTADGIDNGTYFTLPVSFDDNTTTFSNNQNLTVLFNTGPQVAAVFGEVQTAPLLAGHALDLIRVTNDETKFEFVDLSLDDIDETGTKKIFTNAERTKLGNLNDGYKGFFATPLALTTAFPTAANGDFATVGSTDTLWAWDGDTTAWVDTDSNSLGDMLKTTYDPTSINGDAFDMANMVESANEKIFSNAERTKLGDIELNATQDQSNAEIEAAYNAQVTVVSQAEAEAGTSTTVRRWTAERVKQAIEALMTEVVPNINFSYTGENGDGAETKSATYETVAAFIFEGSTALAAITSIKAIASADGSTSADIRVFDATNSLVIAELTGFTNATPEIINLGSISNVPAGEALFELQMLRDGGGGDRGLCSSLQVKF